MGSYADLVNLPLEDLKYKPLGKEFEPKEGKKTIDSEKERQDVIDNLVSSPENVDIWASCDMTVDYNGRSIKVPAGKLNTNSRFALFLLKVYGVNNRYGQMAKIRDQWVHDEPVFEANKKVYNFEKKAVKAEKKAAENEKKVE